ncbi:MAG: hypothetical protein CL477_02940 [Acidobacteria bacterium]|jgi:hypothetical protein|nr:hypothetical protein [Acidobacteriota bacterium]|tara:strand:+ start:1109 stop:1297 length:189 start_codon:yes stop_codon:yes gene_type:complete
MTRLLAVASVVICLSPVTTLAQDATTESGDLAQAAQNPVADRRAALVTAAAAPVSQIAHPSV